MPTGTARIAAALLGLALLGAAPRAAATPFDPDAFAALVTEMNDRDGTLPTTGLTKDQRRERAALNRAYRALAAPPKDLGGDLTMARKMATALQAGYPGDGTIDGLLTALDDTLGAKVSNVRDEVAVTISLASAGKLRDRAQAKLDAADALFAGGAAAATAALRARFQERCHAALLRANAFAVKAGTSGPGGGSTMAAVVDGIPWQANTDFGTGVSGFADVSSLNGGARKIVVAGRQILPSSANPRIAGASSRIQLTLMSNTSDIVPGTYALGTTDGVYFAASRLAEAEDGTPSQAVAVAGTIVVTSLTVREGSIDIDGTFDLTMFDGVASTTFPVASGSVHALGLPRTTVP
jgi:hypothetical protein